MSPDRWPIHQSPFAHFSWPANQHVGLVLDGVAIPELGRQIYQWAGDQPLDAECLYATTRWEAISGLSPWLVWLSGPEDPVLKGFLEQGSMEEQGYLLVSATDKATCTAWMRAHLQTESAPGCEQLMRIAHPALARAVIGGNLTCSSTGVVSQLVVPDCISECWALVEPPLAQQGPRIHQGDIAMASPELLEAFHAFNRRKDTLQLWSSLEAPVRLQLGGPSLRNAYPALREIVNEALGKGCQSLRDTMRFLLAVLSERGAKHTEVKSVLLTDQG